MVLGYLFFSSTIALLTSVTMAMTGGALFEVIAVHLASGLLTFASLLARRILLPPFSGSG